MTAPALLADRALIRLSGTDCRKLLQGLITNDIVLLTPGTQIFAALLTPQGKIMHDFILHALDENVIFIDCEATVRDGFMRRLMMYRLRADVVIEASNEKVLWSPEGVIPDPRHPGLGCRSIGTGEGDASEAYHQVRRALGIPEGIGDFGESDILALESNLAELNGVSFTKGCYVGQENTARMHYRHKVNRRLLPAIKDGHAADDGLVTRDGKKVGTLSPSRHFALARLDDLGDMQGLVSGGAHVTLTVPDWLRESLDDGIT